MAMILDAFIQACIDKLLKVAEEEISMLLGVKDELEKLRERMKSIGVYLESAEQRRHTDKTIGIWVKKLKDVMYDVDDVIDVCMIKGRRLLEDHPSESAVRRHLSLFYCFSCIKFRHEIGSKIRKLNNRLNMILEDQSILSKLEPTRPGDQASGVNYRQTFPDVVKSDIVGTQIEEATQSLVESIIKEDNKKYQVLGIVGMGGIGKTTLASNIYNHESIQNNFPIRVWVCVSKDFEEKKLLRNIIRCAGGGSMEDELTKAELISRLSSLLSKRYFIVLDDVWTAVLWENLLRIPFENAKANGKIVITTRDTEVARKMRVEIHPVNKMDNDSGWEMLRKRIFGDDGDEEEISSLKEIGIKIIEKCDGLPLAIKTIAGVLSSKERTNMEWSKVLKSDAWSMSQLHEELPGALFLSYKDLSSHLKQCFLYCSLFPEDYRMDPDDLIRYWVAEGFVETAEGDNVMEDLAEDYYREIITRNLLQPCDALDNLSDQAGNYCKMHDLLRSLALFLTRDESICIDNERPPKINPSSKKFRRLSIVNDGEKVEVPNIIKQQKCLRTLMICWSYGTKMVDDKLLKKLSFLRVMNLSDTTLEILPDSIGDLLHLRYLNLRWSRIRELPESIGCLVNLQILNLAYCLCLHTLPKAIIKLCNLRCLRLQRTPLTHVPNGIGKLKHLNHLEGFVIGHDDRRDDDGCDLKELQSLSQLRFLEIRSLERAQPGGALVLPNSRFLRTLILECEPRDDEEEAITIQRNDKIYNELSPQSTHLQKLEIHKFIGTGFFSWMMSSLLSASFPNLTSITLQKCMSFPQLPPLGLLPQLKTFFIKEAHAIKTIGSEFLGPRGSSASISFPKLKELKFERMLNWEEWSFGMVEGVGEERREAPKLLPHLMKLKLYECPKLRALPPLGLLPELKSLIIDAGAIRTIGPEFLGPRASSSATSFPKLEVLEFRRMNSWEEWLFGMVEGVGEERRGAPKLLPHLRKLILHHCHKRRALPECLRHATNLQELNIAGANNLKEINNLPPLKSLQIEDWPRLEHVENLDKLRLLRVILSPSTETSTTDTDGQTERFPQWLLELLGQHSLQEFKLRCSLPVLKTFLKDGPNWPIIQPIPQVKITEEERLGRISSSYIRYTKDPPTFKTNVVESEESMD